MNKLIALVAFLLIAPQLFAHDVGVAAVDITPDYNVRLNGFGHRKSESDGVTALHAGVERASYCELAPPRIPPPGFLVPRIQTTGQHNLMSLVLSNA